MKIHLVYDKTKSLISQKVLYPIGTTHFFILICQRETKAQKENILFPSTINKLNSSQNYSRNQTLLKPHSL